MPAALFLNFLLLKKHNYLNFVETEQVIQGNLRIAKARACHVRV